jgi:hypothetical protein
VQDISITKEHRKRYPGFKIAAKHNDIGLIRLPKKANLNQNNIKTICLPVNAEDDIDTVLSKKKIPMTICGFGRLGNGNTEQSDVLQVASIPYVDKNECKKIYKARMFQHEIHEGQLCAGVTNGTKIDNCNGDSGLLH